MHPTRSGFTLFELLITVTVIMILASMLMAVTGYIRKQADTIQCAANLRQIGMAGMAYAADNRSFLPPAVDLNVIAGAQRLFDRDYLFEYLESSHASASRVFLCPSLAHLNYFVRPSTYGWNANLGFRPYPPPYLSDTYRRRSLRIGQITLGAADFAVATEGNSDQYGGETGTAVGYHAAISPDCINGNGADFLTWVPHQRRGNVFYLDGRVAMRAKKDFSWHGMFSIDRDSARPGYVTYP
jgi:prepilin-type processing-associated H-X9-DG protein